MVKTPATLLALVAGQRVLLIDNDMNCGRVYLHLNIPTGQNTLLHLASDFMAAGNQLDGKMLKRRVLAADRRLDERTKVVESKLDVLFGITDVEQGSAEELRGKQGRLFMTSLLDLAKRLRPDLVIMDFSMPKLNGVEATRRIRAEAPGVRVIGLSMFEDADRAEAGRDWWPLAIGWAAGGSVPSRPALVARPTDTAQVSAAPQESERV